MLFYREVASGSLTPCKFNPGGVNATAYACFSPGKRLTLAIINKDLKQDLHLKLDGDVFLQPSREITLQAPRADSRTNIQLGGQSFSGGDWHPVYSPRSPGAELLVPQTSALLIEFEGVCL
jgi:hypothetical protein